MFFLKLWVGLITGSVALTADAYHTLTDSISSGIVIVSGWLSRKPADEKHPFGHGRSDLISSVIIGVLLALIGFEFMLKSVEQIQSGAGVDYGKAAIIVTVISILVKELMAQFAFWAGRKSDSTILKADGWHHRTDALSSVVILIGILWGSFADWIDGALGILVSLMIFYASYEILRDSVSRLIGETPDRKVVDKIEALIVKMDLNVQPHHFHLHRYGDHVELTFHLTMDGDLTLEQAHDQAHRIEQALRDQMKIEATIHMEP
ncbi:cation diffusion facilitator family transporter [Thermodesulfobacteriota bacterium]